MPRNLFFFDLVQGIQDLGKSGSARLVINNWALLASANLGSDLVGQPSQEMKYSAEHSWKRQLGSAFPLLLANFGEKQNCQESENFWILFTVNTATELDRAC